MNDTSMPKNARQGVKRRVRGRKTEHPGETEKLKTCESEPSVSRSAAGRG